MAKSIPVHIFVDTSATLLLCAHGGAGFLCVHVFIGVPKFCNMAY